MKLKNIRVKPSTLSVALSLVLITGCMPAKEPEQWLQDKDLVVQSLQDAHMANAKLQENVKALDGRILSLENITAKQSSTIIALEAQLAKEQEKLSRVSKSKKKVSETKNLNKRLDVLSAKLNPTVAKPKEVAEPGLAEKNAYTAAYLALKSGRYDESTTGFSEVVKAYPGGEYTDQAYYWLGESLVAQRRNKEALDAFSTVASKYPKSAKHDAALLKLASVYQSLGQHGDAQAALARVIREHPDSRSAERARIQLNAMSQGAGEQQ